MQQSRSSLGGTSRNNKKLIPPRVTTPRNQGEGSKACDCTKVPIDSKIRKISKKEEEEEEEEINGGEIKDRGGGGKSRRGVERIVEQEEADVIKRVVSETRPGGNGYPYSYNLLRFQGVDRSSCLRNTRCILIIRTSMTVRATLNYRVLLRFPSPLSLSFLSSSSRPLQLWGRGKNCWNGGRAYSMPSPLLLLLLFLEHGCLRADLNFSRNRNEEEMFVIGIIISLKFTLDIFSCPVYLCK